MIRYGLIPFAYLFLSIYAWRDWYKALCGFIVLMVFASYSGIPRSMFGITGLSFSNILLLNIMLACFVSYRRNAGPNRIAAGGSWDLPGIVNFLFVSFIALLGISIFRYNPSMEQMDALYSMVLREKPSQTDILFDYYVNGLKWLIPPALLFLGCNTKRRLQLATLAIMGFSLLMALLVIRWMPLDLLVDGDALQRRAIKVLARETGYFRTNIAVLLAGAFWVFVAARNYFPQKYSNLILAGAFIILLGMFLTGGRGGYLAWAAVGVVLSFAKWRKYLLLAPLLVLVVFTFVPSVQDRAFGLRDTSEIDQRYETQGAQELGSISAGRTDTWPIVIDKIKEAPLFGHGFAGIVTSGVTLKVLMDFDHTYFHPHNMYLQLLIDQGLIGFLPILVLFSLIVRYSWSLFQDHRRAEYVLAGGVSLALVLAFLVGGMTGQSFYPEERSVVLWSGIALMARVAVQRRRHDRRLELNSHSPERKIAGTAV